MSGRGRGGGRGAATSGVRAIAEVLNIRRYELGQYITNKQVEPPLYPVSILLKRFLRSVWCTRLRLQN